MSTAVRWSIDEYDRMIDSGVFDGPTPRRVELIAGEIREMSPIGPEHDHTVSRLTDWSYRLGPQEGIQIRVQSSVGLPELDTVPQPDVAWLALRNYRRRRPTGADVLLLIEVSQTSLDYDRGEKADLYAAAGIADYWVVDVNAEVVEVRRDPLEGRYRALQTFSGEQEVRPLRFPEVVLRPAMLF
jgi:Uma2 family endonuclease